MPFLEVLTRVYKRPQMLAANQASLDDQTNDDWEQTLLVDEVGRGVGWSYEQLTAYAPKLTGEYIWLLDDDDLCVYPALVADLKAIVAVASVAAHVPDVVMVRMDHGERGVLPPDRFWGLPPRQAAIGCSAYIVRRAVWQAHAGALAPGHYASDFDFIEAIWQSRPRVYWWDIVASRVQRISYGRPE